MGYDCGLNPYRQTYLSKNDKTLRGGLEQDVPGRERLFCAKTAYHAGR